MSIDKEESLENLQTVPCWLEFSAQGRWWREKKTRDLGRGCMYERCIWQVKNFQVDL